MPQVNIPGVGVVNFPDSMSQAEIDSAAHDLHYNAQSPLSRFGSNLVDAVNPMNALRAVGAIPGQLAATGSRLSDLAHGDFNKNVTDVTPGAKDFAEAFPNPLAAGAGTKAGEQIGSGDVAGGLGRMTGDMGAVSASEILPPALRGLGTAGRNVGKAMETFGEVSAKPSRYIAGGSAVSGNIPAAIGAIALPPALRGAGRLLQQGGKAMESIGLPEMGANVPNVSGYRAPSSEVPYRMEEPPASLDALEPGNLKLPDASKMSPEEFQTLDHLPADMSNEDIQAGASAPVVPPTRLPQSLDSLATPLDVEGSGIGQVLRNMLDKARRENAVNSFTHSKFLDDLRGSADQ